MKNRKELRAAVAALERIAPVQPPASRSDTSRPDADRRHHFGRALAAVSDHRSAVARRRATPIMGYVGPNGGGKTCAAVRSCLADLADGRPVLSNLQIIDPATGEQPDGFTLLEDYDQLVSVRDTTVLLDEIVTSMSARSSNLPYQVEYFVNTMRHSGDTLHWTAPAWKRADLMLREVTQGVTECRGYYSDHSAVRADGGRHAVALWAPKRLFRLRTFDTVEFDEWTAGKRGRLKPGVSEWWWGPGSDVFASYNTLDEVVHVAASNETGRCLRCGGTRRAKPCSCGVEH